MASYSSLSLLWHFATQWTLVHQAPPSMEFSRQEYWSGLLCPSPGDLPNPGIKLKSPVLQADSLLSKPPGSTSYVIREIQIKTMRYYCTSIRMTKIKGLTPPNPARMWRNSNCHTLMVVLQNDTATLEDVWHLTKLNILFWYNPAITWLRTYPVELKFVSTQKLACMRTHTHIHKNLHTNVYSSFTHNCQNLEATKMSSTYFWSPIFLLVNRKITCGTSLLEYWVQCPMLSHLVMSDSL